MRPISHAALGAGAILWLSAAAAFAHGGGGGGGGHGGGHYTYVYVPGVGYQFTGEPNGTPVVMPLELTAAPVQEIEGEMTRGDVIAQHTARVIDAVVLLEPVSAHGQDVPAGSVLVKVISVERGLPPLWCNQKTGYGGGPGRLHVCFSGLRGSGQFVTAWVGEGAGDFLAPSLDLARAPIDLAKPVNYRVASVDERPTVRLGYKWCDGDGVTVSPRFGLFVSNPGQPWISGLAKGCVFGAWADPTDHSKLLLDDVVLALSPGSKPKSLRYRFAGPLPISAVKQRLQLKSSELPPKTNAHP